jgi:hypothetical protein
MSDRIARMYLVLIERDINDYEVHSWKMAALTSLPALLLWWLTSSGTIAIIVSITAGVWLLSRLVTDLRSMLLRKLGPVDVDPKKYAVSAFEDSSGAET